MKRPKFPLKMMKRRMIRTNTGNGSDSPRTRSLKSHYRLRDEAKKPKTCRCRLDKEGIEKILYDDVHALVCSTIADLCNCHVLKHMKKKVEHSGIHPISYSFLSQIEIYFFIEKFLEDLEKEAELAKKTEEDEEEAGETKKGKLFMDSKFLSVDELNIRVKEKFHVHFEKQLSEEIIIPKHSICHAISFKGKPNQNEDRFCCLSDISNLFGIKLNYKAKDSQKTRLKVDYYSVFDGHAGYGAAEFCRIFFPSAILNKLEVTDFEDIETITSTFEASLFESFRCLDERYESMAEEHDCFSGTTATIALVISSPQTPGFGKIVMLANCGDSNGFVCDPDGEIRVKSFEHKPDLEEEKDRVELCGGRVTFLFGVARVMGQLGVSRSIGDVKMKKFGVIATPSVSHIRIEEKKKEEKTEEKKEEKKEEKEKSSEEEEGEIMELEYSGWFLVLASDGLWDVVSEKFTKAYASNITDESISVASGLARMAIGRQTTDNVTIVYAKI